VTERAVAAEADESGGPPAELEVIQRTLACEVRPALSAHAGSVELSEFRDGVVHLRMVGSCRACYFRRACVAHIVAPALSQALPDVTCIVDNAHVRSRQ
jgi:Fe-S cluster biogenesis protein NfuA